MEVHALEPTVGESPLAERCFLGTGHGEQGAEPSRGSELPRANFTHTAVLSRGAQPWGPEVDEDKKEEMLEKGNDSYGT